MSSSIFFFNDTATTEISTLSLHDAFPIPPYITASIYEVVKTLFEAMLLVTLVVFVFLQRDRKSTRPNSSHSQISYAVFCLNKTDHDHHHPGLHPIVAHDHQNRIADQQHLR